MHVSAPKTPGCQSVNYIRSRVCKMWVTEQHHDYQVLDNKESCQCKFSATQYLFRKPKMEEKEWDTESEQGEWEEVEEQK